jgi:hypothetical protein
MTDRAQFEAMLNALINEDQDAAKEIFHQIVVGKSREIYQELLAEDFSKDTGNPYESDKDEEEEEEESVGDEEESSDEEGSDEEGSSDDEEGSDEEGEDDLEADFGDEEGEEDPFGGEEEGEDGAIEDRVMDLEDALEDLKAEFEQLLAQEEEEGTHDIGAIHAAGGEEGDDMGGMGGMGGADELDELMEYVVKVSAPKHGDNGVNTKSAVAGKNDMGGTTANIAKSFSTTTGGTQGGLLKPTAGDLVGQEIHNRPGKTNAGKKGFSKHVADGHGAEKAGKKETSDKSTKSPINGLSSRAK